MERIYHYLSVNNYETLKGGGCLEARTTPILCCDENIPLSNNAELDNFCAGKYIVGSNSRDFAAWKKYGLFEDLMRQVGKESCGAVVLLSFSAEDNKNAYILDHRHLSPKTFLELCGEDLWEQKLGLLVPLERGGFPDDKRKI
ncbi:MAG: hypothetical protein KAT91_04455, partial [Candidatus Aenigmarchaeota archaeon]|nr:hypothetical protein [Candidatus Aenigmarchaeota archaeon]